MSSKNSFRCSRLSTKRKLLVVNFDLSLVQFTHSSGQVGISGQQTCHWY
jgi:hypothetical protein